QCACATGPIRGVEYGPALDKGIGGRRVSFWNVGEEGSPTHAHELASVHHGREPLPLDHRRDHGEKKSRRVCLVRSYLITGINASPVAPGPVSRPAGATRRRWTLAAEQGECQRH